MLKKSAFSRKIFERYFNIEFVKLRLVGTELFQADRRTDRQIWRS